MKKSKWETRCTITLSNGEEITATGAMLNSICIAFNECATRWTELGQEIIAKEYRGLAHEIHNYLASKDYYDD